MLKQIKAKIITIIYGERCKGEPIGKPSFKTTMPINCTMSEWESGEWIKAIGTIEQPTTVN